VEPPSARALVSLDLCFISFALPVARLAGTVKEGFDDLTREYRAACPMALNITGIPSAGVGR
jgi:hypothetical protein